MGYRKSPGQGYRGKIRVHVKATKKHKAYTQTRKDLGLPGKGPKTFPIIEKGTLKKFGYATSKGLVARRKALAKAIQEYGALTVWHKLDVMVKVRKRTQPEAREVFQADRDWVHTQLGS